MVQAHVGQGAFADMLKSRFLVALKCYGLDQKVAKLCIDLFRLSVPKGQQLASF